MLNLVVALVLFAHGIGHVMAPLQIAHIATVNPTWAGDSWLLTGPMGSTVTQVVAIVLWMAALVGFVVLAAVVVGWAPAAWWVPLAIGSSALSLVAVALFPAALPPASVVGAVAVDVAVLLAVVWLQWSPSTTLA
jgi:hypothetical protein